MSVIGCGSGNVKVDSDSLDIDSLIIEIKNDTTSFRTTSYMQGGREIGNSVECALFNSDGSTEFIPLEKNSFVYYDSADKVSEIKSLYNKNSKTFDLSLKVDYSYNSIKQLVNKISYVYINNDWSVSEKINYNYDRRGNVSSREIYTLSDSTSTEGGVKEIYAYDANNNRNDVIVMKPSGARWKEVSRIHKEFSDTLPTCEFTFIYSDKTADWALTSKTEHTYNLKSQCTSSITYKQSSGDSKKWVYNVKETYSFDQNDALSKVNSYVWNEDLNLWEEMNASK